MPSKIVVSACLMGFKVRYNASDHPFHYAGLEKLQAAGRLVIHRPKLAAGLGTPHFQPN